MRMTHDGPATLDDEGGLDFCKRGFVVLEGAVAEPVNARAHAWLEEWGMRGVGEHELLRQQWFIDGCLKSPALTGVLRALLGAGYGLPVAAGSAVPDDGRPEEYAQASAGRRQPNCPWDPARMDAFTPAGW